MRRFCRRRIALPFSLKDVKGHVHLSVLEFVRFSVNVVFLADYRGWKFPVRTYWLTLKDFGLIEAEMEMMFSQSFYEPVR
jgi:hypothetical protein